MITLDGFPEFLKAVEQMPDKMKKPVMAGIIRQNLKPVAAAIKNMAPTRESGKAIVRKRKDGTVSTESRPGNLKRSIGIKTFTKREEVTGYAGIQHKKGSDGWYGWFLERGTKYQAKNPFISRAAASSVPLAEENLKEDIKGYIVKNAQKLGLDAK